jgi:hypothetical protein
LKARLDIKIKKLYFRQTICNRHDELKNKTLAKQCFLDILSNTLSSASNLLVQQASYTIHPLQSKIPSNPNSIHPPLIQNQANITSNQIQKPTMKQIQQKE